MSGDAGSQSLNRTNKDKAGKDGVTVVFYSLQRFLGQIRHSIRQKLPKMNSVHHILSY